MENTCGLNFQKKRPYTYGRIRNCMPGGGTGNWLPVLRSNKRPCASPPVRLIKFTSHVLAQTWLMRRNLLNRSVGVRLTPFLWKPLGLRPPATSCRCHPRGNFLMKNSPQRRRGRREGVFYNCLCVLCVSAVNLLMRP
jgi:hypothetical protein